MRKNTLIRVLSLIVAMTCVVVMLCTCSKDKDKKEKEKSEKSEPKSKYAMDVGEFEGKEGEDYTNQVFLFSGVLKKSRVYSSDIQGDAFVICSDDGKQELGISSRWGKMNGDLNIDCLEDSMQVYVLCTSIKTGYENKNDNEALFEDIDDKYRLYCDNVQFFTSENYSVNEIDEIYEHEIKVNDEIINTIHVIEEFVDKITNDSITTNDNLMLNGVFDFGMLFDYEDNTLSSRSEYLRYKKTYNSNQGELIININLCKDELTDINGMIESKTKYNVKFRTLQYKDNEVTIIIDEFLDYNV